MSSVEVDVASNQVLRVSMIRNTGKLGLLDYLIFFMLRIGFLRIMLDHFSGIFIDIEIIFQLFNKTLF